jgi:hypothetical protein
MASNNSDRTTPARPGAQERRYKEVSPEAAARAQKHALASLADPGRRTTNLYMDRRELPKGEMIGPNYAPVTLEQPTVLVFVDLHPRASFGHDCLYGVYDAKGNWIKDLKAQFPPSDLLPTGTLEAFHEPLPEPSTAPPPPATSPPCPILPAFGRRYALLFAGNCQARHANSMEWCYRTLTGPYGFDEDDVFVYLYDGHKSATKGVFADGTGQLIKFPGSDPDYHMVIRGAATSKNLKQRLEALSEVIQPNDMLFIYTDGHGDNASDASGGVTLITFPENKRDIGIYSASDLARDLKLFKTKNKPYAVLLSLFAQCHGGGFQTAVLNETNATRTAAHWAAKRGEWSFVRDDYPIMQFSSAWLSAQRSQDFLGNDVQADGDHDGAVEASEAYEYADLHKYPDDKPGSAYVNGGETIAMAASNHVDADWCNLVKPVMEMYWKEMPEPAFYSRLHRVLPALRAAVLPVLERNARELERLLGPTIRKIFAQEFGTNRTRPRRRARAGSKSSGARKRASRKSTARRKPPGPRRSSSAAFRHRGTRRR